MELLAKTGSRANDAKITSRNTGKEGLTPAFILGLFLVPSYPVSANYSVLSLSGQSCRQSKELPSWATTKYSDTRIDIYFI
jgi:hypothetical protein